MKLKSLLAVCVLSATAVIATAAGDRASADEAIAMTKKAVAYMKSNGKEKALAEFSDPKSVAFHDRDLYVIVLDKAGVMVAHGANPKLVGKDLSQAKDADGKLIGKGLIDIAGSAGKGWFDYKWPNPTTKAVESKSTYVEKADDLVVGVGIYK